MTRLKRISAMMQMGRRDRICLRMWLGHLSKSNWCNKRERRLLLGKRILCRGKWGRGEVRSRQPANERKRRSHLIYPCSMRNRWRLWSCSWLIYSRLIWQLKSSSRMWSLNRTSRRRQDTFQWFSLKQKTSGKSSRIKASGPWHLSIRTYVSSSS